MTEAPIETTQNYQIRWRNAMIAAYRLVIRQSYKAIERLEREILVLQTRSEVLVSKTRKEVENGK